jgi:exocyst complex component 3
VDFFRIVNEQVAVVEEVSSADMLLRTGEAILHIMRDFQARSGLPRLNRGVHHRRAHPSRSWAASPQEAQQRHLMRDLSDALLCAMINNNFRCYNESTEFAEHLDAVLADPLKARQLPPAARTLCRAPRALAAATG